jgi:hypothetical protein
MMTMPKEVKEVEEEEEEEEEEKVKERRKVYSKDRMRWTQRYGMELGSVTLKINNQHTQGFAASPRPRGGGVLAVHGFVVEFVTLLQLREFVR